MKKPSKKTIYRILAMLLVVTLLGANATTLSYATSDDSTEKSVNEQENQATNEVVDEQSKEEPEEVPVDTPDDEPQLICGKTEHTHSEACYEDAETLTCELEEDTAHEHVATCFWEEQVQICEKDESAGHSHDVSCYEGTEPICGLEAADGHDHDDSCYKTVWMLTCTKDHEHADSCSEEQQVLSCKQSEESGHSHDLSCYEGVEPACGEQESEGHTHGEACFEKEITQLCEYHLHGEDCYTLETELTCEQEEHTHTEACYPAEEEEKEQITVGDESGAVEIFGLLPTDAAVEVTAFEDEEVLAQIPMEEGNVLHFAYDISILVDGAAYQPDGTVEVTVQPTATVELDPNLTWESRVYHITAGGEAELVTSWVNTDGSITFVAEAFSVYSGVVAAADDPVALEGEVTIGTTVYQITNVKTLINANLALLANEAKGSAGEAVSGNFAGVVYPGFSAVYAKVYELLLANPTHTFSDEVATGSVCSTDWIWKISGTVSLSGILSIRTNGRVIIVSEGAASLVLSSDGRITVGFTDNKPETSVFSAQGKNAENRIFLTSAGTAFGAIPIRIYGGSVYLANSELTEFLFDNTEHCVLRLEDEYDRAKSLYMVYSSMNNVRGPNSPGIFCTSYKSSSNENNVNSYLYFYDNTFSNCITPSVKNGTTGGPVLRSYAADYCKLRMEKCTFTGNKAGEGTEVETGMASGGGAIYWKSVAGGAQLIDCTFENNYTTAVGGAILNTGNMELIGCKFFNNTALNGGGAIAVEPPRTSTKYSSVATNELSGTLTLDSQTIIQGNTASTYGGGIYFNVVSGHNGSGNYIKTYKMRLIIDGATITGNHANTSGGAIAIRLNYGSYEYETGISILPGSTLRGNTAANNGGAIWMYANASCERKDNQGVIMSGGVVEGNSATNGGAIYIATTGTGEEMNFTMSGGTTQSNTATQNGGAAYVSGGNFSMTGGNLGAAGKPNRAKLGGGVYVAGGGAEIAGGFVESNSATNGGGVYLAGGALSVAGGSVQSNSATNGGGAYLAGGALTVTGGSVESNSAANGGGAYLAGGALTVTGGSFEGNTATGNGGGAYLDGGDFTLNGGSASVANNTAVDGGGVYLTGGKPLLKEGTLSSNTATGNGGGIYIDKQNVTLVPTGIVTVSGNKADGNGAGIYIGGTDGTDASFAVSSEEGGQVHLINNGSADTDNGGGVCISKGQFTMNADNITVTGNQAVNGGGVAVLSGNFSMSAGSIGEEGAGNSATNGGGVYVSGGEAAVTGSGSVQYNSGTKGGGIYLTSAGIANGNFTLDGETASVANNTAVDGGGVYLTGGQPLLKKGTLSANRATGNGGGIYIDKQNVTLTPTGVVTISGNKAEGNGAGIYIGGTEGSTDASFAVDSTGGGEVQLINNGSANTDNGGGVCISNGQFTMDADNITITGNQAVNGGGVAVLSGSFSMSAGSIGEEGAGNSATNGGGVYVKGGSAAVSGGSVQHNSATNGGGASVSGGDFVMTGGTVNNNTASANGGGIYVSGGNFRMENGMIGGAAAAAANTAQNGGGVYVADGNVTIIKGSIDYNTAEVNGGGMLVSANTKPAKVIMLSGSLSHNSANGNGGGMAVESSGQTVTIEIGCLLDHGITAEGQATLPIDYTGDYSAYSTYGQHTACPVVKNNSCANIGGGFYLNSDQSTLNFYCVIESGNQAADGKENCWGMDVEGGTVVIGDSKYHNSGVDGAGRSFPYGYVQMDSPILVNGGKVDIFGDMHNPHFAKDITVNITQAGDYYIDHRRSEDEYKIHYVEDFLDPVTGVRTGEYIARQYNAEEAKAGVVIDSALFIREGYEIKGWYTGTNGTGKRYNVGETYDLTLLGTADGMGITESNCGICGDAHLDKNLLKLYAYWVANGFDVIFDPNVPLGTSYVPMPRQTFTYGSDVKLLENTYKYAGHIFTGWNTKKDGSGTAYADKAVGGKITNQNGVEITLYAQWKVCTHDSNTPESHFIYSVNAGGNILTRECSCGGQKYRAVLSAQSVTYDGLTHPAKIRFLEGVEWPVTLSYKKDGAAFSGEIKNAGTYLATLVPTADPSVRAEVTFVIEKAEQDPPLKPTYTIESGATTVLHVLPVAPDPSVVGGEAQYRVVYKTGDIWTITPWTPGAAGTYAYTFETNIPLTNYFVEARYDETENYKASPESRANQVFYYEGGVNISLICEEGITGYLLKEGDGVVKIAELDYDDEDYYLIDGDYEFSMEVIPKAGYSGTLPTLDTVNRKLSNIPQNCDIKIYVSGVKLKVVGTVAVTEKQVFAGVSGTSATISQDASFTAYYTVSNYDTAVYDDLQLSFQQPLPKGATIILWNKADSSYWGWTANGGETVVLLQQFTRMGSAQSFEAAGTKLEYRFIVDFSRSGGAVAADWTMTLGATKDNANAPILAVKADVRVKTKATFAIETAATAAQQELTQNLRLSYTPSAGVESKWDDREMTLVLKPDSAVPADTKLSVTIGTTTIIYPMVATGEYVIPLSDLQSAVGNTISITLQSALFPVGEASYNFTAKWMFSSSLADVSPLNGEAVASKVLAFQKSADKEPSLKISGTQRLLPNTQALSVKVEYQTLSGYTVEAEVLKKFSIENNDGSTTVQYSGIGMMVDIDRGNDVADGLTEHNLKIPLTALESGSYCVMITVKKGILKVIEVPYYFIVQ